MKFEIYQSGEQFRWRLRAANHEIVAAGEAYTSRQNCLKAIQLVMSTNNNTPIEG